MKDEWQLEMDRMLDVFEHESESSLRKINRRFKVLGLPFNDKFREQIKKMTAHRLDVSFTKIETEQQWDSSRVKTSERNVRKIIPNCITSATASSSGTTMNVQLPEDDDDDIRLIVKSENVIEIPDSDDEDDDIKSERSNGMRNQNTVEQNVNDTINQNDDRETKSEFMEVRNILNRCDRRQVMESDKSIGEGLNASVVVEDFNNHEDQTMDADDEGSEAQNDEDIKPNAPTKDEISISNDVEFMNEVAEIPIVVFDPTQENDQSSSENDRTKQQMNSSPMASNQSKRTTYRFKCEHCDSSFKLKRDLKSHQPIHANGKLIGIKADSNGLYHCALCVRQFIDIGHLSMHMKSHNDGQYLYDCARCMSQFDREAEKDKHESQCKGYHFECHLCKVFVTKRKLLMQTHMRKHSGDKPFHCTVCGMNFSRKDHLKRHSNTAHNRKKSYKFGNK